eukprot:5056968-Prymnesium_polylepis.1
MFGALPAHGGRRSIARYKGSSKRHVTEREIEPGDAAPSLGLSSEPIEQMEAVVAGAPLRSIAREKSRVDKLDLSTQT